MAGEASAGYSGTPLVRKLGYHEGARALIVGLPAIAELRAFRGFAERVERPGLDALGRLPGHFDLVQVFETEATRLEAALPALRAALAPTGAFWVSWPKKAAKVPTTLTEDRIRAMALAQGLVDVKVCAVDAVWSGLKLMIPRALREGAKGLGHGNKNRT